MRRLFWRGLARLLRWLRPREGWAVFLSLMTALLALSAAVNASGWLTDYLDPYTPVLLGLLFGLLMARRHPALVWLLAILLGGVLAAKDLLSLADLVALAHLAPLSPRVISGLALFLLWLSSVWASWITFRWRSALAALSWTGLLLGGVLFFSVANYFWGGVFLFAFILLAISLRFAQLRLDWEARGVDYSPEIALDVALVGLILALGISLSALAMPSIRVSPITDAFWRLWAEPYATLEARISPLFSRMQRPPRALIGGGSASPAIMPRAHLLGGKPELTEQVVMTVRVTDPDPGAPAFWSDYRWRGPTYARYSGRGWDNPPAQRVQRLGPGETWLRTLPADRRTLRQRFHFVAGRPYWLYAQGEPVATDTGSRAYLLGDDNLLGMTAGGRRYEVISQAPIFDADHLRTAPNDYPPDLAPYLALPPTITARTRDLAARITADTTHPYDQALAIQNYLRTAYPYTLEIPAPPAEVDVVDYFLFDLQKGYCDYYASAMIILTRSLGIPARLAVGYAPGAYDPDKDQLIVREKDAHSWPELYFPGYGWIPFEPTPARPTFLPQPQLASPRVANKLDLRAALQALRRQGQRQQLLYWGSWLLALGFGLLLGRWAWREWRLRRRAANAWQRAWLRLERTGPAFGVTPAPWLTPREVAARWQAALSQRYAPSPIRERLLTDITVLAAQLEARTYAPPARRPDDAAAAGQWRRIWLAQWRLRLLRK